MNKKWTKKEIDLLLRYRPLDPSLKKTGYKALVPLFPDRTQDALRFKWWELNNEYKLENAMESERIGVIDIETTDLKADVGFMLGWAMYYPQEGKTVSAYITKKEMFDYKFDKRICKKLLEELKNVDVLITYFGTRFDIPFSRTRCLINGVGFPRYAEIRHIDCYYFARGKVATRRKSLGVIAEALGLDAQKTHESISVWNVAKYGKPNALKKIRNYNINDVIVTWDVYNELKKYGKYVPKSI